MPEVETNELPTSIVIDDASLIRQLGGVMAGRQDKTLTKTVKDLLREKITEIRINGDDAALNAT